MIHKLHITSFLILSVRRPAPLRLISSTRNTPAPPDFREIKSQSPSFPSESGPLGASRTPGTLTFGQPSLPNSVPPQVADTGVMDWTPSGPVEDASYTPIFDREDWIKPATFFAPEVPTGLEDLLQSTSLGQNSPKKSSQKLLQNVEANVADNQRRTLLYSGLGVTAMSLLLGMVSYWMLQ